MPGECPTNGPVDSTFASEGLGSSPGIVVAIARPKCRYQANNDQSLGFTVLGEVGGHLCLCLLSYVISISGYFIGQHLTS